jgi:hypothetical protein
MDDSAQIIPWTPPEGEAKAKVKPRFTLIPFNQIRARKTSRYLIKGLISDTGLVVVLENQAYRLGDFVKVRLVGAGDAADILQECAFANNLTNEQGIDAIEMIIARGLKSAGE